MTWADDVRRANEALDWIEARQGPLKPDGYARIETTVGQVRAMAEWQDDARLRLIRAGHTAVGRAYEPHCGLCQGNWPCDTAVALARLDALAAEAADVARENEALIEEVKAAGEQITALAAERDECQRMLEDLTPGGSEFYRNPIRCRNWVQDRLSGAHASTVKAVQERDALAARLAAAESALERGRMVISDTLDQVVPDPCLCGTDEYCRECLAVGTLEQALAERAAIQAAWNRDRSLLDVAIDHHMSRWKQAEAERDDALARLAAAEALLQTMVSAHCDPKCRRVGHFKLCYQARAALAGSRERAASEGE